MRDTLLPLLLLLSLPVLADYESSDVHELEIGYVYQFDSTDPTAFDIYIPSRSHQCGTALYRSYSPSEAIANRKFSLALAAFTSGKKISFRDTGVCEGNRVKIGWMRIVN
jgi:hypothetical protein